MSFRKTIIEFQEAIILKRRDRQICFSYFEISDFKIFSQDNLKFMIKLNLTLITLFEGI